MRRVLDVRVNATLKVTAKEGVQLVRASEGAGELDVDEGRDVA